MPKVSFYILTGKSPQLRERFACKLVEKAYRLGHHVYIQVAAPLQAQELDDLLWTFRPGSFVPHARINTAEAIDAPVLIGQGESPETACDLLINLSLEVPAFFSRFKRIAEIIDQEEALRQAGRQHYRYYRDHDCVLETHELQL
jgi:DNA polymerase III subunit chi